MQLAWPTLAFIQLARPEVLLVCCSISPMQPIDAPGPEVLVHGRHNNSVLNVESWYPEGMMSSTRSLQRCSPALPASALEVSQARCQRVHVLLRLLLLRCLLLLGQLLGAGSGSRGRQVHPDLVQDLAD